MPDLHPKDGSESDANKKKSESSGSSESEEDVELSAEDIKNIKKLIADQDASIAKKKD